MSDIIGRSRFLLLAALMGAMLLANTGVVLAQTHDESRTAKKPTSLSMQAAGKASVIPDRYIVVLKDGAGEAATQGNRQDPEQVASEMTQKNKVEGVTHTYGSALKGFAAKIPVGKLEAVRSDPRVAYVAQDREIHASAQSLPKGINRVDGDLSSTNAGNSSGSVNADVAIIDTGIYDHVDLNIKGGYNCTSTNRSAWADGNGHGTHVAGTVAARDNTIGVVGAAPGARLWAIKVLNDNGQGSYSSIICGINRVTQMNNDASTTNNIEVANMSLGGGGADDGNCGYTNNDPLHKAVCKSVAAKITFVVAAGNDGSHVSNYVPASYNEVITVSALADYNGKPFGGALNTCNHDPQDDDDFAYFSNFGSDVDVGAPGVCINSTWKGGGYKIISGTSMASPHVAGAAALRKSTNPGATPDMVKSFIVNPSNSEALGEGHTDVFGVSPEPVLQLDNY